MITIEQFKILEHIKRILLNPHKEFFLGKVGIDGKKKAMPNADHPSNEPITGGSVDGVPVMLV